MNATSDTDQRATAEFCSVVLDNACRAAPQGARRPRRGEDATRARCFACANPVCTSCSTILEYCGGRRRVCATCEENIFEDGEARLLLRAHHRAGYPEMTLEKCAAILAGQRATVDGLESCHA